MAEEDERRRSALSEISFNESFQEDTPNKNVSADEMVIAQRGPRRKPIIWSPVDLNKGSKSASPNLEVLHHHRRSSLNAKLRRRLILSPTKTSIDFGGAVMKKLRSLPMFAAEFGQKTA